MYILVFLFKDKYVIRKFYKWVVFIRLGVANITLHGI